LEVDTVLKTDDSSRVVEPEAAAVVDVLSEVETIGLGGTVPFVIGVRLEVDTVLRTDESSRAVEPEAVEPKAAAVGWLCVEEKSTDLTILTGGELGIEISISDLNQCKWDTIYLAFNK